MEFKITEYQEPGKIAFNYSELKEALLAKVSDYKTIVYTDEQMSVAKKDRAELNKLKKALNDERIRQEKEFFKPFETFKAQVKELCGIIDDATKVVDSQVKAFEDERRIQRENDIKAIWDASECPEWMVKNDPKWMNASVSINTIKKEIDEAIAQMSKEMEIVDKFEEYSYEAGVVYKKTHDLSAALKVVQIEKENAERKKAWEAEIQAKADSFASRMREPKDEKEPARKWIGFQALLSAEEAKALGAFLKANGIKYKAI